MYWAVFNYISNSHRVISMGFRCVLMWVLIAGLGAVSAFSQEFKPRFTHFTEDDGLAFNALSMLTETVIEDSFGYIWVATQNGLSRYDGYEMKSYFHDPDDPFSLPDNNVRTLIEGPSNQIWIVSNSGVSVFDHHTETFTRYPGEDHMSFNALEFVDDVLWLGSSGDGLYYFDANTHLYESIKIDSARGTERVNSSIYDLYYDDEFLWLATESGLYRFDTASQSADRIVDQKLKDPSADKAIVIHEDGEGRFWVADGTSLRTLNRKTLEFSDNYLDTPLFDGVALDINSIEHDDYGNLWVALGVSGIALISDTEIKHLTKDNADDSSLVSDLVGGLHRDRRNRLWVSTLGGVGMFPLQQHVFKVGTNTLDKNGTELVRPITNAYVDNENYIWVGSIGAGFSRRNIDGKFHEKYFVGSDTATGLKSDLISAIIKDKDGVLWIGTFNAGVFFLDPTTKQFVPIEGPKAISDIVESEDGVIWVGSMKDGLGIIDKEKRKLIPFLHSHLNGGISTLLPDGDQLWIGTVEGLIKADINTKKWKIFRPNKSDPSSISHRFILDIHKDDRGQIWVSTNGGGLNRLYRDDDRFKHIDALSQFSGGVIYGAVDDEFGNLWLGTPKGIVNYNPQTNDAKIYRVEDGIFENDISHRAITKTLTGEIVMGSPGGFVVFDPELLIGAGESSPILTLTKFSLFNKTTTLGRDQNNHISDQSISTTEHVQLDYRDKQFSFDFAAIGAAKPERVLYEYRLQGWDDTWIESPPDRRFASFTNIPSGDYVFTVRASDKDGAWGKSERNIKLTIVPPFWNTVWAYIFYVLIAILAVFSFIQVRTSVLRNRAKILEQTVAERTQELERQNKTIEQLLVKKDALFANVSHEFRTPLTLILGPIQKMLASTKALSTESIKKGLETSYINANRLLKMVDQLLDLAKNDASIDTGDRKIVNVSQMLDLLLTAYSSVLNERDINIVRDMDAAATIEISPQSLEKILSNLISNAIKYSPESSELGIGVHLENERVLITIKDQGLGIEQKNIDRVFDRFVRIDSDVGEVQGAGIGLALVKQLTEIYNGTISVVSEKGEGSTFLINFPKADKAHDSLTGFETRSDQELLLLVNDFYQDAHQNHDKILPDNSDMPIVLVVEDNRDMQGFIKESLEDSANIVIADNGAEGLEKAKELIPDLIITDLMMPLMNGLELSEQIRSHTRTSHIPIIMLTANANEEVRMEAWKTEIDEYIEKPFNAQELGLRVENLLSIRRLISQRMHLQLSNTTIEDCDGINVKDRQFIEKLDKIIDEKYRDPELKVKVICQSLAMSESQVVRKLKALLGQTMNEYLRIYRLKKGAELLRQGERVTEACYAVGFSAPTYFSSCFKAHFGVSPKVYIESNAASEEMESMV